SFFDRYGAETTRFGEGSEAEEEPGTMALPRIYSAPRFSLAENISIARDSATVGAIQKALMLMSLVPKEPRQRTGVVMLDESGESSRADLFHRQCFIGFEELGTQPLVATDADVKAFRPANSTQVSLDYYAIDLEISLRSGPSSAPVRVVCRFPLDPI